MGWGDVKKDNADHLSATQIQMFQRCPLQYKFRYVDGIKTPPDSGLILGITVHKGVEHNYAHKFRTKKAANKNEVMDAFAQEFDGVQKSGVDSKGQEWGQVKDLGYRMTETHYDKLAPAVQPLEKPEYGFQVDVTGVRRKLIGYIDVLARVLSIPLAVLDNKTTRRRFTQWESDVSTQLTAYAYAVQKLFKKIPVTGMDVVAEKRGGVEEQRLLSVREPEQLRRFEVTVQHIEKAIDSGTFYPTDQQQTCSWCGYNKMCHARATAVKNASKANYQ